MDIQKDINNGTSGLERQNSKLFGVGNPSSKLDKLMNKVYINWLYDLLIVWLLQDEKIIKCNKINTQIVN